MTLSGTREGLRERRRAAGLGPGAFLDVGVKASEIVAYEEGEEGMSDAKVAAVLERIAAEERSKRYELPAKASYTDRLAGLD